MNNYQWIECILSGFLQNENFAITAVICLGPVIAWLQYVSDFKNKFKLKIASRQNIISLIEGELRIIENWTGKNGYQEESSDNIWYRPWWHVLPFKLENINEYNRSVKPFKLESTLSTRVLELEKAIQRFFELLSEHERIVKRVPALLADDAALRRKFDDIETEIIQPHFGQNIDQLTELEPKSVEEITKFNPFDNQYQDQFDNRELWRMKVIYNANKKIHLIGIGNKDSDPPSLFIARKNAIEELAKTKNVLQFLKPPWWLWIGNILGAFIGIIGLVYLGIFLGKSFNLI